jgi:hypothetical protein
LTIQPRERSSRAAIWSTFSASGNGIWAVSTLVSFPVIVDSLLIISNLDES